MIEMRRQFLCIRIVLRAYPPKPSWLLYLSFYSRHAFEAAAIFETRFSEVLSPTRASGGFGNTKNVTGGSRYPAIPPVRFFDPRAEIPALLFLRQARP